MNKRGFDCALSRATLRASCRRFSASLPHFSPLFFLHITRLLELFFFLFYLVPQQVSNHLPFAYISLTSLSSTPLHHEIQLRFIPQKVICILLDSLACPKINITSYCVLHACCTLHENMHHICGSLENKRWWRWFISFSQSLPPELSIKLQSSVFIYKYNVLPNFLPKGLCRQNKESSCGVNRRTRYDCWDWWV